MALLTRTTLLLSFLFFFSGCSHVSYLWQAGVGQLAIYNHERPLTEVIDDPRTDSDIRERLKWIPEIKKFVESELGVKATHNYTTYVDLKRPYVIWSLTAAKPFAIELVSWKFPIVGAFPYLGFFKQDQTKDWAEDYKAKGFDTAIRGVTAYSTLGYLRDPLLSTMLSRQKSDLVNLIFHETTHGVIYMKGQGSFNEQLASYIGEYGERYWIIKTFGEKSAELKAWIDDRADRRRLGALLKGFAEELKAFYASSETMSEAKRKSEKEIRFEKFWKKLENEPWQGRYAKAKPGYFPKAYPNNAALLAHLTYEDDQSLFDLVDKKNGGSLRDALRYLKSFEDQYNSRSSAERELTPQAFLAKLLAKN